MTTSVSYLTSGTHPYLVYNSLSQALKNLVKRSSRRVKDIFNKLDRRLKSVEKNRSEEEGEGVDMQQTQKTRGLSTPDLSSPTTT